MGNKTIYIKDDNLWQRARLLAGKGGLSSAIEAFLAKFVAEAQAAKDGFTRQRLAVQICHQGDDTPTEHIAFNGRLVHKQAVFVDNIPSVELAVYQTKAGKLVLTIYDIESPVDAISYYQIYDSLKALSDDPELTQEVPEEERLALLDALSKHLGQEWAVWIE